MMFFNWRSLFICSFLLLLTTTLYAQSKPSHGYHVIKQYKLGGEGGWDYLTLDAKTHRLYISRSTHVMVVDADSGALVGDIPDTAGVHGIVPLPDMNKGYTSNGRASTVTVFDLKTLKALKQIPVGKNPDAIIYDPLSKRVFTFNGASNDATAIDVQTDAVAGTIALDGRPEFGVSATRRDTSMSIWRIKARWSSSTRKSLAYWLAGRSCRERSRPAWRWTKRLTGCSSGAPTS